MNIPPATLEKFRVLVIEDDQDISALISLHLKDRYETVTAINDGLEGLAAAKDHHWDLILLDIRLPGIDGLEICRMLRADEIYTPILMLTSKATELDQVLGLEMGADDYVTKPFSVMELMSRVKAILRRVQLSVPKLTVDEVDELKHGNIILTISKRTVTVAGELIDLTAREFELLCFFLRQPGEVFSRAQLLDKVWGYGHQGYEHTVNSHINRLRAKIEADPTQPKILVTVWGVGYKLDA